MINERNGWTERREREKKNSWQYTDEAALYEKYETEINRKRTKCDVKSKDVCFFGFSLIVCWFGCESKSYGVERWRTQWPKRIKRWWKQNGQLSSCTNLNQNIACEIKIARMENGRLRTAHSLTLKCGCNFSAYLALGFYSAKRFVGVLQADTFWSDNWQ